MTLQEIELQIFPAYDRATGKEIMVDSRTFDEKLHSLEPLDAPDVEE